MVMTAFTLRRPQLPVLALLMATMDFTMGAIYVIESKNRTMSAALSAARDFGPLWGWGAFIAVIGLVAILAIAWGWHPQIMMSFGVGWHMFFAGSLIWSVATDNRANAAGIPVFLTLMVTHFLASRQR